MDEQEFSFHEKHLALVTAYLALVRTLQQAGVLEVDRLLEQLNAAQRRLGDIGETGAQQALQSVAETLTGF